ncbi:hypothetical protein JW848_01720 [Candidatus Bipolaricaulota bacterium]|nr:hypothetical protein [Candidatus Bipolaricaulota bacterium]
MTFWRQFNTLMWVEARRSWVWAVALVGSLLFWAWGMNQVDLVDSAEQLGVRAIILVVACGIGAIVLCLMVGRIRSETRHGQYQVLLLTPPSGYVHVAARFLFAGITAIIYYVIVGGLAWWAIAQAHLQLDAGSVAQLVIACPLYGVAVGMIPVLAWTILLMVFISSYRIAGPGWIPGTVMILATPFLGRWIVEGIWRVSYRLPGWRLFEGLRTAIDTAAWEAEVEGFQGVFALPQEPLWIMLALSALMLAVAGRIWQEVEG